MANTNIITDATSDTSATHTTTSDNQNVQVFGLGQAGKDAYPRVRLSVAADGSRFVEVATLTEDGILVLNLKTGGAIKAELLDSSPRTKCTVSILE